MTAARWKTAVLATLAEMDDAEIASIVAEACAGRPTLKRSVIVALTDGNPGQNHGSGGDKRKDKSTWAEEKERKKHAGRGKGRGKARSAPMELDSSQEHSAQRQAPVIAPPGASGGERLEVAVTSLGGSCVTVVAYTEDLVATLKRQIAQAEGTLSCQQKLLLGTQKLDSKATLSEYGPFERSAVELTLIRTTEFISASRFEGCPPGYVFKLGENGLGWYIDKYLNPDYE
mmetsp:Transcript_142523/g.251500  ORF Transcript_142523/g.251500 Transcript_142523/m.251500 type:complete len:230 (+) Transcript_142523:49-738(+)